MSDLTCARCGREMAQVAQSLPQGMATCRPCRRLAPGPYAVKRDGVREAKEYGEAECPICHDFFAKHQAGQVYCSASCRESRRNWSYATKTASAEERGYGKAHREERARWKPIVEGGQANCCICGYWIEPGTKWHLDHTEDRTGYRGAAHAQCNLRDGASRGARRTNAKRQIEKACVQCGRQFVTPYPKQRYCSSECRPKAERKAAVCKVRFIDCAWCGVLFAARPHAKTCGPNCSYALNKASAVAAYRLRVGIPLDAPRHARAQSHTAACVQCGDTVETRSRARLYCSKRCQKRAYRHRRGTGGSQVYSAA